VAELTPGAADPARITSLIVLASGLAVELRTTLRLSNRRSTLAAARALGIVPEGTRPQKKALLRLTVEELRRIVPGYEPNPTVRKAMDAAGLK
jgi:hypothetical protein